MSGPFLYVFIPADHTLPIEERTADKQGGLSDDELIRSAKNYFHEQSGGPQRAAALDTASAEETKRLAAEIRSQAPGNTKLAEMSDVSIMNFIKSTHTSPQCEIIALTVPTAGNQYHAVSMYISEHGEIFNDRATKLVLACGHQLPEGKENAPPGVYGDVFVGRCHDDEARDDWTRVDLRKEDVTDLQSPWITIANAMGGGGGHGRAPASLSGVLGQMHQSGSSHNNSGVPHPTQEEELGYTWDQTKDEVEIKFKVSSGTKAKYCKVTFGMSSLKVTVAGQTLCQGPLGGKIVTDESTFTIQDEGKGRELCVTLTKKDRGAIWAYAVPKKEDAMVI
jgi:hypothetical protein